MKVLILHAYSATNLGDGLLVEQAIEVARAAYPGCEIAVAAQHPSTFDLPADIRVLDVGVSGRGVGSDTWSTLRSLDRFDLVLGVGGGYLRFGSLVESAKTSLVHLPQLIASARTRTPTVYLPQSVGPLRFGTARPVRALVRQIDTLYARDDRTFDDLRVENTVRFQDLALLRQWSLRSGSIPDRTPVLSVRKVHGRLTPPTVKLAQQLEPFYGYVQSTGAGNDDSEAMYSLDPRKVLSRDELLSRTPTRVVIAVRLHAALMALHAGHYVIHLSYERKGFGAFGDLGLSEYVHNVNSFDSGGVKAQVDQLLMDSEARYLYDAALNENTARMGQLHEFLVASLRSRNRRIRD